MTATRPEQPVRTALTDLVAPLTATVGARIVGPEPGEVVVTGLTLDSRRVSAGDLYVAAPGAATHGARFADAAVQAGAVAVLTDEEGLTRCREAGVGVPVLVVPQPRQVIGRLAAQVYGDPAAALSLVAVTGTQGKTTTTRLAEAALRASGTPSAVIGTIGTRINGADVASALTTPEAPDLHALFALMREQGVRACAMEVSSHALVMGRVDGVRFDVAVFTNLGRDHLDFHADMEEYFAAKAALFTPERARLGLVNIDDEHGRRLVADAAIPMRTFSLQDSTADWHAADVTETVAGSTFTVVGPHGRAKTAVHVPGDFNVANGLCAIAALVEAGFPLDDVATGLSQVDGVPGRLERVDCGQPFLAVVDYAHKPDALEAALTSLRAWSTGRLILVIGAGGDRDRGKRPLMGATATKLADIVIITDDNPRTESPAVIRREVLGGARAVAEVDAELHEVGDRGEAIRFAVRLAREGDTVIVAGKGHETGQEVAGHTYPFDDRAELTSALHDRTGHG